MTGNKTSILLAVLGVLAILAKGVYIVPPEDPGMEMAIGLSAGIFLMGFAWHQAGGRFLPARSAAPARRR